jgi:hypothetical protein
MVPNNINERFLGRLFEVAFIKAKKQSIVDVIEKGNKPNTYILNDNYFSPNDTITDGWQIIKIIGLPDACPSNEKYGAYWIYTFDQELQEPIKNCELWKTTTNPE